MDNLTLNALSYFQPPVDYFWKWSDRGSVIEFKNGRTVCYRQDLSFILESLNLPQQIPLGTFVLLLCACKYNFEATYNMKANLKDLFNLELLDEADTSLVDDALGFLLLVNSMPANYQTGLKRISLFQAIFEDLDASAPEGLQALLHVFKSGELDAMVFYHCRELAANDFKDDLLPLAQAFKNFPTKQSLELKLRTGLTTLPGKADVLLPAPLTDNLFDVLDADIQTAGISNLARHIIGALSIPMHLSGSSDQSVGGVSDISNRGHYDKLLLSELAQDDLLLTARLANNEALFLQREELPVNNSQEWHILLDTTLKMWGLPRIFGLATGLAFSEGRKKKVPMNAWALGGTKATPIDMHSKEGIVSTLEQLDPALNCGAQLARLLARQKGQKGKYIMITAAHYIDDTAFLTHFLPVKNQLDYLVVVSREGHIQLFETLGGRHKLINQATIDLNELLFSYKKRVYKNTKGLPAMLQTHRFPLYFPSSKIKMKPDMIRFNQHRAIVITQDKRVLLWKAKDHGAIELVDQIESGEYFWGDGGTETLFLLIKNPADDFVLIYHLDTINYTYNVVQSPPLTANDVRFHGNLFHIKSGDEIFSINPSTGKRSFVIKTPIQTNLASVVQSVKKSISESTFDQLKVTPHFTLFNQVKKFINNGYSVINSVNKVYKHTNGQLFVDNRCLILDAQGNNLGFKDKSNGAAWTKQNRLEIMHVDHLPNIKFSKFIWPNGSEAVADSRGLLHLKSANTAVCEVTIVLIIDKTTACWAADGKVTGSAYFIGPKPDNYLAVDKFYASYIQPFIDNLN